MAAETEQAVEALAEVVREFVPDDTVARLEQFAEKVRAAQQALAGDFDALDEAAQALVELIDERTPRLLEEAQEAVDAITGALEDVEDDAQAMATAAEETAGAIEALDSAAGILTVNLTDQLVSRTDAPAETLAEQVEEAARALDQSLGGLFNCLREIVAHELDGARKTIIHDLGAMAARALDRDGQRLGVYLEEWAGRVAGGADDLKKGTLAAAAAHPAAAVAAMMETCAQQHRELFAELVPLLAELSDKLPDLRGDVARVEGVMAEQYAELLPLMRELETDLEAAAAELEAVSEFLRESLRLRG